MRGRGRYPATDQEAMPGSSDRVVHNGYRSPARQAACGPGTYEAGPMDGSTTAGGIDEPLLSPRQVARYLGIPVSTLYQWRYRGEGPPGFKLGNHVRYRRTDVDAWLRENSDRRG